jgi:NAD(P)-dependent dehydrogenase (short-subunit alcohol dehydrogenase family)
MAIADLSAEPIEKLIRLDGRCAAITGGARGIGLAIGRRLAEAGAAISIGDLDGTRAEAAAAELQRDFGVNTIAAPLDVRDGGSISSFCDRTESALGPIDIWVNNAAIYPMHTVAEMPDGEWDAVSDVNLRGCFLGASEAARRMTRNAGRQGRVILNMASVSGARGRAGMSHYVATKHAVIGLTKSLAIELGPKGIRVLALAPTLVMTPGLADRQATGGASVGDFEARIAAQLPLGRIGLPDDVARVALFCVSDMAALMTGTTVFVDAGATAS